MLHFKKGKSAKKKSFAVYGEGAVTDRMCRKWSGKYRAGDFSLDDAPRLGRPAEVDSNSKWDINWEQSMLYHMGGSWHIQKYPNQ